MPRYKVKLETCSKIYYVAEVEVEAKDEIEARNKAWQLGKDDLVDWREDGGDNSHLDVLKCEQISE